MGALSKPDEFLLNPHVRICSAAVPGTSSNSSSENQEPTGDRSLGNCCLEAMFSAYHSSDLIDPEQEEAHYRFRPSLGPFSKVFRIGCVPLHRCTFVMDMY